jgi:hypothetical protein
MIENQKTPETEPTTEAGRMLLAAFDNPTARTAILAIEAEAEARATVPPALDVERLARAIDETGTVTWDDDPTVLRPKTPTEIATDAAPRYARLAREASDD